MINFYTLNLSNLVHQMFCNSAVLLLYLSTLWVGDRFEGQFKTIAARLRQKVESRKDKWLQLDSSLAKWLSVRLRTKWFWVRVQLQSPNLQISRLLRARSSFTFTQLWSVDSLWNAYVTWQEHTVQKRCFS